MNLITLIAALLISLWTAAWLHWCFHGNIRHFLFAYIFPSGWRAGRDRIDVLTLPEGEFEMWLAAESAAPLFIRGLFGCPGCLSAHIAALGVFFVFMSFPLSPWLLPLIWAGGAYLGHRLHRHI